VAIRVEDDRTEVGRQLLGRLGEPGFLHGRFALLAVYEGKAGGQPLIGAKRGLNVVVQQVVDGFEVRLLEAGVLGLEH